jgi:hypothetical protein
MDYSRIAPAPAQALNCQTPAQKIAILPKGNRHDLVTFLEDFKNFKCVCTQRQRLNKPAHRKTLHIYDWKSSNILPYGLIFDTLKQDRDFKAPGCKMLKEINFKPDSPKITALKIDKKGNMTFIYKNYKLFEFLVMHQKLYIYNASFHALTGEDNMTAPRSRDLKKSNDKHIKFNNIIIDLHEFLIEYNEDEYNDNNKINYEFLTFSFSSELYNNNYDESDSESDTEDDKNDTSDSESDTDSETASHYEERMRELYHDEIHEDDDIYNDEEEEEQEPLPRARVRRHRRANIYRGSIPDILDELYEYKYNGIYYEEECYNEFKTSNNSFSIKWQNGQYNIYSYNRLIGAIDNRGNMALICLINKLDNYRGQYVSKTTSNHISKVYNYFRDKINIRVVQNHEQIEEDLKYNLHLIAF